MANPFACRGPSRALTLGTRRGLFCSTFDPHPAVAYPTTLPAFGVSFMIEFRFGGSTSALFRRRSLARTWPISTSTGLECRDGAVLIISSVSRFYRSHLMHSLAT